MSRRTDGQRNPHDGEASNREKPFRNSDVKRIEFDAFRKSAPLTRHDRRGVIAMRTMGAEAIKGTERDKTERNETGRDGHG